MTFGRRNVFIERLKAIVERYGHRPAVCVDGAVSCSYDELWRWSGRIALALQRRGIGQGATVALLMTKSPGYIAALLGVWRCRAAWVPVEPTLPKDRVEFLVNDSAADVVVSNGEVLPFASDVGLLDIGSLVSDSAFSVDELAGAQFRDVDTTDLAYVMYTSGTTGRPKGVEVSHRGLVAMLDQQIAAIELDCDSRSLFLLSTSFDASVSDIGTSLLAGASLWIESSLFHQSRLLATPTQMTDVLDARQITYVDMPPSVLAKLDLDACPRSLQTVLVGGEICPPDVVRRWASRVRLVNVYGPTEATVCSSFSICDSKTWDRPLIGRPLRGVEYRIADGQHEGELLIGGECLARGYRNLPDVTKRKFFEMEGGRFYRTGDRVRLDVDGEYVFLGRIDRQVKLRGQRIEPSEIESVLLLHARVQRAAVIKHSQTTSESEKLIAFVTLACDANSREVVAELRELLDAKLPAYFMPQQFEVLVELPLTISGKIDYCALEKWIPDEFSHAANVQQGDDDDSPFASRETTLLNVFQQVLGHCDFDAKDHFLHVGGDSFGVLEVCVTAQSRGLSLSPQQVATLGSVHAICDSMTHQQEAATDCMTTRELRDDIKSLLQDQTSHLQAVYTPKGDANRVLLTGATGFLGCRLLARLLLRPDVQVVCLVRAENDGCARRRLESHLEQCNIVLPPVLLERVTVMAGDVGRSKLGLKSSVYRELAMSISQVVHSAAEVNVIASYARLRQVNVVGVNEIARFVLTGRPKWLDYISTLSVFVGTDRCNGTMLEADNLSQTHRVYGGYAQSKWAAEVLLRECAQLKRFTRYFRLGLLTTDTESGGFAMHDLLTLTVKGVLELGCVPDCSERLRMDVTPVNYGKCPNKC